MPSQLSDSKKEQISVKSRENEFLEIYQKLGYQVTAADIQKLTDQDVKDYDFAYGGYCAYFPYGKAEDGIDWNNKYYSTVHGFAENHNFKFKDVPPHIEAAILRKHELATRTDDPIEIKARNRAAQFKNLYKGYLTFFDAFKTKKAPSMKKPIEKECKDVEERHHSYFNPFN